ncbi:MAG: tetratricopeptide repeat protein [Planctomycetota bacterium]|nr:tetratricopeptide repeat protein [Planctomycetota bacterium]
MAVGLFNNFYAASNCAAEEPSEVEALVKLLGSDSFSQREASQKRLLALGEEIKDALLRSISIETDPEVLVRVKYVLSVIVCKELRKIVMKKTGEDYGQKDLDMCKTLAENISEAGPLERDAIFRMLTPAGVEMLIQQLRQLLRDNPEAKDWAYVLGCSLYWQENYDEAISAWLYAEQLDKQFVKAILSQGQAYMKMRNFKDAERAFDLATRLYPQLADPVWGRAMLYAEEGDFKRALEVWRSSNGLRVSNESEMTYSLGLGCILAGAGDIKGAKKAIYNAFEEIKATHSGSTYSKYYSIFVYREFAKILWKAGLTKEYEQNLVDAKANIPNEKEGTHPDVLLMEADSRLKHGDLMGAAAITRRVILVRGETASLRKLLSETITGVNRPSETPQDHPSPNAEKNDLPGPDDRER